MKEKNLDRAYFFLWSVMTPEAVKYIRTPKNAQTDCVRA